MDKLKQIKSKKWCVMLPQFSDRRISRNDVNWLICEIERLRKTNEDQKQEVAK